MRATSEDLPSFMLRPMSMFTFATMTAWVSCVLMSACFCHAQRFNNSLLFNNNFPEAAMPSSSELDKEKEQQENEQKAGLHTNLMGDEIEHPVIVTFAPDNTQIATGNTNAEIDNSGTGMFNTFNRPASLKSGSKARSRLWSLTSGLQLKRLPGHHSWRVTSQAFTPDGKYLATTGFEYTFRQQQRLSQLVPTGPNYVLHVWNTKTGESVQSWEKAGGQLAYSKDGSYLISTSTVYGLQVFKIDQVKSYREHNMLCSDDVPPLATISDRHMLVVSGLEKVLNFGKATPAVVDLETGEIVQRYTSKGNTETYDGMEYNTFNVQTMALDAQQKRLAVTADGWLIVWQFNFNPSSMAKKEQQTELVRVALPEKKSVSAMRFTSDPNWVTIVFEDGLIQEYDLTTKKPKDWKGLVAGNYFFSRDGKMIARTPIDSENGYWDLYDFQSRKLIARFHQPFGEEWAVETSKGSSLTSDQVRQNQGESQRLELSAALRQVTSAKTQATPMPPSIKSSTAAHLFVLAIGVSQYKGKLKPIRFADKDARQVAELMKSQSGNLYKEVFITELINEDASRGNILEALNNLKRSSTDEDQIVVMFSGHGEAFEKGLYLKPWDSINQSVENDINWESITRALEQVNARHILILLDCCQAGSFGKNAMPIPIIPVSEKLRARATVFCSADAGEAAIEVAEMQHGLFIGAILEGLKGAADINGNSGVQLNELISFTCQKVSRLSNRRQNPKVVLGEESNPTLTELTKSNASADPSLKVDDRPNSASPAPRQKNVVMPVK